MTALLPYSFGALLGLKIRRCNQWHLAELNCHRLFIIILATFRLQTLIKACWRKLFDKISFMRPEDQLVLRDCMRRQSLLDRFSRYLDTAPAGMPGWLIKNAELFIEVCELHGQTSIQHHEQLISKFIEIPVASGNLRDQAGLTASGPPLPVLLEGLKRLCDMRAAADNKDILSWYGSIEWRGTDRLTKMAR